MLTRRDVQLIAAASRPVGSGDGGGRVRKGCLPGCTVPLLLFIVCGLPFDILMLAKALGLVK